MLEINKLDEKNIEITEDNVLKYRGAAVYFAQNQSGGVISVSSENTVNPAFVADFASLQINGVTPATVEDAVKELNSFVGSFSGGGENVSPEGLANTLNTILRNTPFSQEFLGIYYESTNPMFVPSAFGFAGNQFITKLEFPNGYTSIPSLSSMTALQRLTIPNFGLAFGAYQFTSLNSLEALTYQGEPYEDGTIKIPNNVTLNFGQGYFFNNAPNIKKIILKNTVVTQAGPYFLYSMSELRDLVFLGSFQLNNGLYIVSCPNITRQSLIDLFNALNDRTGQTAFSITITAASYNRLTPADIAIATAKNFTVASGT